MHLSIAAVVSCLAGLHCSSQTIDTVTVEPELSSDPEPVSQAAPPEARDEVPAGDRRESVYGFHEGFVVTSTLRTEDGAFYSTGTFRGELRLNGVTLHSKGSTDVFIEKQNPDGSQAWAKAVGSSGDETAPNVKSVSPEGVVTLLGMTTGRLDCGGGPLAQYATETFFMCLFEDEKGTTVGGGTFPTGAK